MITNEQSKDYLNNPNKCPRCGSDDLDKNRLDYDENIKVWGDCKCNACNFKWREIYSLTNIEDLN